MKEAGEGCAKDCGRQAPRHKVFGLDGVGAALDH
jgi:hypothetical protein